MKRFLFFLFLLGVNHIILYAQNATLKFNKNGEFKIVQFTDVHFKYGNPASDIALERIDEVLKNERPDLVVLTGDVMGVFVGHDHDNDYAVMWHGILLAYGRYTGGNTVYNHLPNGARVIVLKEGQRTFDTWIDLAGGQQVNRSTYPDSFVKK